MLQVVYLLFSVLVCACFIFVCKYVSFDALLFACLCMRLGLVFCSKVSKLNVSVLFICLLYSCNDIACLHSHMKREFSYHSFFSCGIVSSLDIIFLVSAFPTFGLFQ